MLSDYMGHLELKVKQSCNEHVTYSKRNFREFPYYHYYSKWHPFNFSSWAFQPGQESEKTLNFDHLPNLLEMTDLLLKTSSTVFLSIIIVLLEKKQNMQKRPKA